MDLLMKKLFFAKVLSKILLTFATKTPITAVASSGPEDPAAMKVAPATSGGKFNTTKMTHCDLESIIFKKTITFSNSVQSRNKVVITYNGQSNEHINSNQNMNS